MEFAERDIAFLPRSCRCPWSDGLREFEVMRADRESQVRVGVSACLLGHQVRYDGGDKRDRFLTGTLGRFVEFVAVCPEVEIGLGVPRETLRLERRAGVVHLVGNGTGTDHTAAIREYSERRVDPF